MSRKNRTQRREAQRKEAAQRKSWTPYEGDPYAAYPNWEAFALSAGGGVYGEGRLGRDDYSRAMAYQISSMVNRGVDLLAQAVNSMPWEIVRANGETVSTSEQYSPTHPAAKAIQGVYARQGVPLFSLWTYSRYLNGETYLEKTENIAGVPGLRWLNPYWCEPIAYSGTIDGYWYGAKENGIQRHRAPADKIAYDRTFNSLDDIRGLSKVDAVLTELNLSADLQSLVRHIIDNNARPGVIISPNDSAVSAGYLPDGAISTLERQLIDFHRGKRNASNALISPFGLNITTLDLPELEKYYTIVTELKKAIALGLGTPMSMMGDSSNTTFKDGDEVRISFFINTIIPLVRIIQDFFNIKLMPYLDPYGGCSLKFDTAQFEDSTSSDKAIADLVTVQLSSGYLLLNEARIKQGLNPLPELDGMLLIGGMPTPIARIGQIPPTPQYGFGATQVMPNTPPLLESGLTPNEPEPQKGAASLVVMLSLANNPDLIDLQKRLKAMYPDPSIKWNDPSDFHITMLYVPAVEDTQIDEIVGILPDTSVEGLSLKVGSLACFDNVGEHALHFRVARNSALLDAQASLYDTCEALGLQASSYSRPAQYTPHITMGYLPEKIGRITFHGKVSVSPVGVICSVERGGEDEIVYPLEGDQPAPMKSALQFSAQVEYQFEKPLAPDVWREKALGELKAWQKHIKTGKTRAFEPVYTAHLPKPQDPFKCEYLAGDAMFDALFAAVRYEPFKATLARIDRVFNPISRKDIGETRQEFEDEFLLAIADAKDGVLSKAQLRSLLHSVIRTLGEQAFRDGLEDGGVKEPQLTDEDQLEIARLRRTAEGYANDFVKEFDTYSEAQLDQRPKMWTLKTLNDFYLAGLASADANGIYVWKLGQTEEHCQTCLQMNGQRMRLKTWLKNGILPQSDKLACKGFNCDCGLFNIRGGARG